MKKVFVWAGLVIVALVLWGIVSAKITNERVDRDQDSARQAAAEAKTQPAAPITDPPIAAAEAAKLAVTARKEYADTLESHLLSIGMDAHVRAVGPTSSTLRIGWKAMSRPIVYNMLNSPGMQREVPQLGFRKVIFTDEGSFSGSSRESYTLNWVNGQWRQ